MVAFGLDQSIHIHKHTTRSYHHFVNTFVMDNILSILGSTFLAIFLALFSSLALAGLIDIALRLEDPFDGDSADDIRVTEDLGDLMRALKGQPCVVGNVGESGTSLLSVFPH